MAALLLFLFGLLIVLSLLAGIAYVAITVHDHMSTSPEAAKAIYDHVFLPVFVGVHEPGKPKSSKEPSEADPGIDLDELKL
jgi:hypothetical protein